MTCAASRTWDCDAHRPLGRIAVMRTVVAKPLTSPHEPVEFDPGELSITHADPVVGITPELLNEVNDEWLRLDVGIDGATLIVLDRRYDLVGYCEVAGALVGMGDFR